MYFNPAVEVFSKGDKDNGKGNGKGNFIYTPEFEKWYSEYPRPQAKADSFKNFEKVRKDKGLDYIWQCTRNYQKYYETLSAKDKEFSFSSNNFFGQKAYYKDFETEKQLPKPQDDTGVLQWLEGKVVRQ